MLNLDKLRYESAPATSVTFEGNGSNIIYVDLDNDLVVVVRPHEPLMLAEYQKMLMAMLVRLHGTWEKRPRRAARTALDAPPE